MRAFLFLEHDRELPSWAAARLVVWDGMVPTAADLLGQLPATQQQQLARFAELMLRWNKRINVTASKSVGEVLDHCADGVVAASLVPATAKSLVDIGSGGGLPAIPIAIVNPGLAVLAVEPIAKKWAFLVAAARELGLPNLKTRQCRVEELNEVFDVASSKATFELTQWLERGQQLVDVGGAILGFGSGPVPTALSVGQSSPADVRHFMRGAGSYWVCRSWRTA